MHSEIGVIAFYGLVSAVGFIGLILLLGSLGRIIKRHKDLTKTEVAEHGK